MFVFAIYAFEFLPSLVFSKSLRPPPAESPPKIKSPLFMLSVLIGAAVLPGFYLVAQLWIGQGRGGGRASWRLDYF